MKLAENRSVRSHVHGRRQSRPPAIWIVHQTSADSADPPEAGTHGFGVTSASCAWVHRRVLAGVLPASG
jgi:hypothetical protein